MGHGRPSLGTGVTRADGGRSGGAGNFSLWPEYMARVGKPVVHDGTPVEPVLREGVWTRRYTRGLAIVNPTNATVAVVLPAPAPGTGWVDLYGTVLLKTAQLPAASGLVLQDA